MINLPMRVIVMFDLPTLTKEDRRNYSKFRKRLLEFGFYMLQFSIYVKIADNHEHAQLLVHKIKHYLPPKGQIRSLTITDRQYQRMLVLLGDLQLWEIDYEDPDKTIII